MRKTLAYSIFFLIVALLFLPGCAQVKDTFSKVSPSHAVQPSPRYFDFNDVLIPGDLSKDTKESYITSGHGRLVVTGRVKSDSLARFFNTSMYSDGWTVLNQYEYQGAIKIFFKKSERIASILITENPLGTRVEIWVVPLGKR